MINDALKVSKQGKAKRHDVINPQYYNFKHVKRKKCLLGLVNTNALLVCIHYPVTIERTIGLVLGPSTALYEPFLKHCTLTYKAVGTI